MKGKHLLSGRPRHSAGRTGGSDQRNGAGGFETMNDVVDERKLKDRASAASRSKVKRKDERRERKGPQPQAVARRQQREG